MTAASLFLFPVLAGPLRSGRVLAIIDGAVYLQLDPVAAGSASAASGTGSPGRAGAAGDTGRVPARPGDGVDRAGAVIALLSRTAVRLPFGLVMPDDAAEFLPVLVAGTPVTRGSITIGWGALRLGGLRWPVLDWWNPAVPTLPLPPPALSRYPGAGPRPGSMADWAPDDPVAAEDGLELPALTAEVGPGLSALAAGHAEAAVRLLIGIGPGLTPIGDDVLCGALAALACWAPESTARHDLARAISAATDRTTPISAAQLQAASAGGVIPPLAALLTAIGTGTGPDVTAAISELARRTADSGNAMAVGAVLQFRLLRRTARTAA